MARHAGTAAPPPPHVGMPLLLPARKRWDDDSAWTLGRCWLCSGDDLPVIFVGPIAVELGCERRRIPAYGCAECLVRISHLAAEALAAERR